MQNHLLSLEVVDKIELPIIGEMRTVDIGLVNSIAIHKQRQNFEFAYWSK